MYITKQCFCEDRCPVSLNRRKIAGNSRLKGASWSKFAEFADEFAAIRAAEFAEKLHQRSAAQPPKPPQKLALAKGLPACFNLSKVIAMTFKVLIIEDNHSFIDTLKVMLRDLPLEFCHAYRYNDAQAILAKHGTFYNRHETDAEPAGAAETSVKMKSSAVAPPLYNENGIFLVIVEQQTETSMKGTDFIAHAIRKYPGLGESDFILLTHRLDAVPTRNYGFPVIEKPLRAPQIRQLVLQKIKQAQELAEAQASAGVRPVKAERPEAGIHSPRKRLRHLLKRKHTTDTTAETQTTEQETQEKSRAKKPAAKKAATAKKAKSK
jgi:CheY-like chemotaxis protein